MRGQSWRCGPWAFCSTLCYSVRIPSVMWARSWRPNSSPRSHSLQVYCSLLKDENSLLFFLLCYHWLSYKYLFPKNIFLQSNAQIRLCALRTQRCVTWAVTPWPCSEDDSGPASAAVVDQSANFPGRVQLGRGGSSDSDLLWVFLTNDTGLPLQ